MPRPFSTLWSIVREFNLSELREELERPVRIALVGYPSSELEVIAEHLCAGDTSSVYVLNLPLSDSGRRSLESADLALICRPATKQLDAMERSAVEIARRLPASALLVASNGSRRGFAVTYQPDLDLATTIVLDLDRPNEVDRRLAEGVLDLLPDRHLALGRQAPRLRERVAERLIRETSKANAQFAAMSSLPGWIPILGSLAGNGADLVILTKNQVLLVYKLAGIFGRDVRQARELAMEVLPVVGGAFFWRSLARSIVGLLPGPVAIGPKTAVAYAGTAVVGEIAHRYFRDGVPLSPEAMQDVQRRALARLRRVPIDAAAPTA